MQQNAGPARAEHHRHFAGGCRSCLQIGDGRLDRFIHILRDDGLIKIGQTKTAAATGRTHFAPALLLGNHGQGQAHQRSHIGSDGAVSTRHQHHVVFAGQPRHDLRHTRVFGAGLLLHLFQQLDLGRAVERGNRV